MKPTQLERLRWWLVKRLVGKEGDIIEIKDCTVSKQLAAKNIESSTSRVVPDWLSVSKDSLKGTVMRIPSREDIHPIANEQAVVEFYSR